MNDRLTCEDARDLSPELSLGIATGEERGRLLEHVVSCPDCRGYLAEMSAAGDELLLIAPIHEPPAGFDERVIRRLAEGRQVRPRRVRRVMALAAAAVLAAGVGGGAVWWALRADRVLAGHYRAVLSQANGQYFVALPLRDPDGDQRGVVFAYQGDPAWLFVTIRGPIEAGPYRVELVTVQGGRIALETRFSLSDDQRSFGAIIPVAVHDTAVLRVLDELGRQVLTARVPAFPA